MTRRSLAARIAWRVRHGALQGVLRVVGRPVRCATCGRPLFRAFPVVYRGRLRLIGASESNVRVAFDSKDSLRFSHLELDRCPAPDRPWVRVR